MSEKRMLSRTLKVLEMESCVQLRLGDSRTLRPIFLELGCLADICELITLRVEGVGRESIM